MPKKGPRLEFLLPDRKATMNKVLTDLQSKMSTEPRRVEIEDLDLRVLKDLREGDLLGREEFGRVCPVRHTVEGGLGVLAVKCIPIESEDDCAKRLNLECVIQEKIRSLPPEKLSPYIVSSYGAFIHEGEVLICMGRMDTSLDKFCMRSDNGKIKEDYLPYIAFCMVSGLQFLKNELNVIHRDVKPSNILVSRDGHIKLCDFGVSGILVNSLVNSNPGTYRYLAPEKCWPTGGSIGYGVESDVWSAGITMIEITTGKHPYDGLSVADLALRLTNSQPPSLPDGFPIELRCFVSECCVKDPKQRPKFDKLMRHELLKSVMITKTEMGLYICSVIGEQ